MKIHKRYYNCTCKKCHSELDRNGLCPFCFEERDDEVID